MKEDHEERVEFIAWINKKARMITFRETDGFEKLTFRTQEDKMAYVYDLCESGYRIL